MFVNVSISLAEGESPPSQTPADFLTLLGGNPDTDSINVTVSASHAPPPPPPPAPPA